MTATQSAHSAAALGTDAKGRATEARLRWGWIGSSDNHRSRPGTGYVEAERQIMTDGVGYPFPDGVFDERGEGFRGVGGVQRDASFARHQLGRSATLRGGLAIPRTEELATHATGQRLPPRREHDAAGGEK